MLTPGDIDALRDAASLVTDEMEAFLLDDIARRIAKAGEMTSTASYQAYRLQTLGKELSSVKKKLAALMGKSEREIEALFTQAAQKGSEYRVEDIGSVPFEANRYLLQVTRAAVELMQKDFKNITQTIGMIGPDGKPYALRDAYTEAMDYAFTQVYTGTTDYNTAIRQATKNLASYGLRTIDYESGVHTSLEAATRRNIMGGMGLMVEKISRYNHDTMGADGWEISAHGGCAPDHAPIQGLQYSDKAYDALNGSLRRPIGTLNCGHIAYPIILGLSIPAYSKEYLQKLQADNDAGVTYQGKHYTLYQASQKQRDLERAIRTQKRRTLVDDAIRDKEQLIVDQIRLGRYREEYARFSKAAHLRTQGDRLHVAGFGISQAQRAVWAQKKAVSLIEELNKTITVDGIKTSVTRHVLDRATERGVSAESIIHALTKPLKLGTIRSDRSRQYIGEKATVAVDVDHGKIRTVWPTSTKRAHKLKEGG